MNKILRNIGLSLAVAGSLGLGTPPASAEDVVVFHGVARINCFGCGTSSGSADLCAIVKAPPYPPYICVGIERSHWDTFATYTVFEAPGQCPVTGSATGATTGAVAVTFSWTRVGANAVITTAGDVNGGGVAAFKVTEPAGLPCGGPVVATVAGTVAGA